MRALVDGLRRRRWWSWLLRFVAAGLLYLPTYIVFGGLAFPFVEPYYTYLSASAGVNLELISRQTLIVLQLVRGPLFVLALWPFVLVLRVGRWQLVAWLALALVALTAWPPILAAGQWPAQLRIAHGIELTFDSLVQALSIGVLLGFGTWRSSESGIQGSGSRSGSVQPVRAAGEASVSGR